MFGTKSAKRISFASAYLPKRQQHNVAGFLTRFQNCAFPSSDSGFMQFQLKKLTAAGTVQDSHLFPSQDLNHIKSLTTLQRQKYTFFENVAYLKHVRVCQK